MKIILTTILLFLTTFLIAQDTCSQDCFKKVTNDPLYINVEYTGCVDRFDTPNGKGKMYIVKKRKKKKIYKEGCFENGKLNGFGRTYSLDGENYVEGNFTNGEKVNGIFLKTTENGTIYYEEYVNGKLIKSWNNKDSKYNQEDIISTSSRLALDLIKHPRYSAYFIDVEIGLEKEIFLFDTGASINILTKKTLNKLKRLTSVKLLNIQNQKITIGGGKKVSIKYYYVESLMFENLEVKNIIFAVFDKEGENASNILGLDFFENKFSRYSPDLDNKKIYLEK